jgi:perosamine synthetase
VAHPTFPVSKTTFGLSEYLHTSRCITNGQISGSGTFVDEFEMLFSQFTNKRFAISVSNGTAALHLSLLSLGVKQGDEVIVPAFGFVAFANAVLYVGATPIFVDIDKFNWTLDVNLLEKFITTKTKAVIAVHNYGAVGNIEKIANLCKQFGISLIEDCAESLGGSLENSPVGCYGDLSTYSFFGNKVISCGEGGAITTNSEFLAARIRQLRGQGMDPNRRYFFPVVGYNYRLSNLSCALLVSQMKRIPKLIRERWRVFRVYSLNLSTLKQIQLQTDVVAPWLFTFLLEDERRKVHLQSFLESSGIETRPTFFPLPELPTMQFGQGVNFPQARNVYQRGLSVPTYPRLKNRHVEYICSKIKEGLNS